MLVQQERFVDLTTIYDENALAAFVAVAKNLIEKTNEAAKKKEKEVKRKTEKKKIKETIKCCENAKEHLKVMTGKIDTALCENIQLELIEKCSWYRFGKWYERGIQLAEKWEKGTTIVIVLESPHKDEYKHKIEGSYLLARGSTGSMIKCVFCDILEKLVEKSAIKEGEIKPQCRVIIMNAIPFQCSLGEKTQLFRDKVFRTLWYGTYKDKSGETKDCAFNKKFYDCLCEYKSDIIFNFCTQGDSKVGNLQNLVQAKICEYAETEKGVLCFVGKHPCSWGNKNNLSIMASTKEQLIVSSNDFALYDLSTRERK